MYETLFDCISSLPLDGVVIIDPEALQGRKGTSGQRSEVSPGEHGRKPKMELTPLSFAP